MAPSVFQNVLLTWLALEADKANRASQSRAGPAGVLTPGPGGLFDT